MHYSLLLNASLPIQLHFIVALAAFFIGAYQLIKTKGTNTHKWLGRIWVGMMLIICITSFSIKELMADGIFFGYSPIHLLSIFVIYQIIAGVYFARVGKIAQHKSCMLYTYIGGLLIAGAFTFYPGRLLYNVFLEPFF